jgi:hypothetical protein
MFERPNSPPPPDPGKALAKALEGERKKAEQAAARKIEADRVADLARRALDDQAKLASATPFGQAVVAAPRRVLPTAGPDEGSAPQGPAATVTRPASPRGFFSDASTDD